MNGHITKWLAAYHDGELRGRRLAQVENHLAECADCQAELNQLQALSSLLGEAPEAPNLTSPDRFSAQVGLRLARQPQQKPDRINRPGWVWTVLPIALVIGLAFLKVVQLVSGSLSIAQMFGYGEAAVSRLTSTPVQSSGLFTQISASLIDLGIPFSPQILIGLILPAILAVAYMLWLIVWGLNQREFEATQS
jgi:predicted anti-sigma-YlaC factor YlaD